MTNSVLFLFAHQDDEIGVLYQIEKELSLGVSVYCAYTTTGVLFGSNPDRRNAESRRVLESLGVDPKKIFFQAENLNIPDGQTFAHINSLRAWLKTWSLKYQSLTTMYVPAWEGGHPDHDVLHAVAVHVGKNLLQVKVLQYPLYNSYGLSWGFFRVLYPLDTNGDVLRQFIPWPVRFKHLMLFFSYRSQFVSWLGLYPFVLYHYLFNGHQFLQPTSLSRILQRPHIGQLYYEFRGFSKWTKVFSNLQKEL
jgi:LmbE family N-acetylglucosaminyl deacetylase